MSFAPKLSSTLLLFTVLVVLLPIETLAFGAGDVPDFSYLNDKAFRHGDIENILETLVKSAGGTASRAGLLGIAHSIITSATGGAKFSKSDIKKVYFGNWLRDYSQAMDIAGLSKLTADTIILIVSILGFMSFGFATEEFQVTADRLGVYLPVEHIDNPKGYAAAEGDARRFNSNLRPPVNDRELEIDERTGMKNYMASEGQGWDTSTAFIRRTFCACIEAGRRAGGREGPDLWEAYRLLGTGLHTMEDLLAHSNWCEIALRKMGHEEVFCHVGDDVIINTPSGPAPPLVTGSFGGADFIHSLMGEATDHISQASVTDLTQKMNDASQGDNKANLIKDILSKLPIGGGGDKMSRGEQIQAESKAYNFDPDNVAPPEVQQQLLALLKWRDDTYRDVVKTVEMVPGLENLLDQLSNALNAYVYTIISPYVSPILQQATTVLGEGSKAVIDTNDQYEVFDNPRASDPTHSFLAKDHFALILNEPAGKIAQIVVEYTVNLIVPAWSDDSNPHQVIDQVLEAFHHPYYATGQSRIQYLMFEHMQQWLGGLGPDQSQEIIRALNKESVRNGKNKRPGSEEETQPGLGGHSHGSTNAGGQYGGLRTESTYGQGRDSSGQGRQDTQNLGSYGGRCTEDSSFEESSDSRREDISTYGEPQRHGQYGSRRSENDSSEGQDYGRSKQGYQGESTRQSDAYEERATYSSQDSRRAGEHERSGYGQKESSYGSGDDFGSSRYGQVERTDEYGRGQYRIKATEDHSYRSTDHGNEYGAPKYERPEERPEGYDRRDAHQGRRREEHSYGSNMGGDEYSSSGYGQEGRSDEYDKDLYGRKEKNQDSESYGSSVRGGSEHNSSGYDRAEARRKGEDGGYEERSYGSNLGGDEYSAGRLGTRTEEHSYARNSGRGGNAEYTGRPSGYGGNEGRREGYSGEGYGGSSGYNPSYGGEETYGAERLNISGRERASDNLNRDDDDGERHHGRRHRKHDDEG